MGSDPDREAIPARGAVVVFDLEYTSWEGAAERGWSGPGEHREIVQIGAVRLDAADGLRETGALERLVRPARNPVLSDYFVALTGIAQAAVDRDGVPFTEGLIDFLDFCNGAAALCCNGWDHRVIEENCNLAGIPYPLDEARVRNVQPILKRAIDAPSWITSSDLPRLLGLETDGPAHQGLADARAIAAALRWIANEER